MTNDFTPPEQPTPPEMLRVAESIRVLRNQMEKQQREGRWPVPGRRRLLQSPIWHDPKVARDRDGRHGGKTFFVWRQDFMRAIGTSNAQPMKDMKDQTGRFNPGGLLQWMDLDMMMFLSALFAGKSNNHYMIDADQQNIFDAIGYQRLDDPPYFDLRSAIKRLTGTQLWEFAETAEGEINYNVLPPLLVTSDQEKRLWVKEGRRVRLVVEIGPGWISEVQNENQIVDLNSYLYLVRELRRSDTIRRSRAHLKNPSGEAGDDAYGSEVERPPDVSRAVLLFLDSLRTQQKDKSYVTIAKTDWLMERFADRHTSLPYVSSELALDKKVKLLGTEAVLDRNEKIKSFFGDLKRPDYKYLSLLHERGKVRRALDAITRLGIMKHYCVDGDKLMVEWADPSTLPRLQVRDQRLTWNDDPVIQVGYEGPKQQKYILRDKLTDSWHFVAPEELSASVSVSEAEAESSTDSTTKAAVEPVRSASPTLTDEKTRRLFGLVKRAHGSETVDEVVIQIAQLSREDARDHWTIIEEALVKALGPKDAGILLMAVNASSAGDEAAPSGPSRGSKGEAVGDRHAGDSVGWEPLLKFLLTQIPKLTMTTLAKWRTEFKGEAQLVAMLVEVLNERAEIKSKNLELVQRAGVYANKHALDERWDECFEDETWCRNVAKLCSANDLPLPSDLLTSLDRFTKARTQKQKQMDARRQQAEKEAAEERIRQKTRTEEAERTRRDGLVKIHRELRKALIPYLDHWEVVQKREEALALICGDRRSAQWLQPVRDRSLPDLRDIFLLIHEAKLVSESWYPLISNLPPIVEENI